MVDRSTTIHSLSLPGRGGDDVSLVGGEGAAEDGEVVAVEAVLERPARRLQAVRHRHEGAVPEPELVALLGIGDESILMFIN